MIQIKRIDEDVKSDINIPNEPFTLWGKMIPKYDGAKWAYTTVLYDKAYIKEMIFPEENYDFDRLKAECFFIGAYDAFGTCVGLAIYKHDFYKYLYLSDLKVNKGYRGHGIGKMLIEEGKKVANENGYFGIYTIAQDNNLSACLFYLKSGFEIGGLNTHAYKGTNQSDKADIYFYSQFESR